jgi:hypothetical protein
LQNEIEAASEDAFNRYYGLVAQETEFMPDGSIVTTNSEAVITTVFGVNEDGYKTITETITPNGGLKEYTKVTTIIPATETTNKKVTERYTSNIGTQEADPTALQSTDIDNAIATEWNGESSQDETAMDSAEVSKSLETEWNGETSEDTEEAISASEINTVLN